MNVTVRFTDRAVKQLERLDRWWRENRPAAADQVENEIERLKRVLAESPEIGTLYPHRRVKGVRVVRLNKTPYRLYYRFDEARGEVLVLAAWSAVRKHGPAL